MLAAKAQLDMQGVVVLQALDDGPTLGTGATVSDLKKHFPLRGGFGRSEARVVHAVDGVSFHIDRAETLALVGESGCGKSTVGRAILRLFDITAGQIVLDGKRIDDMAPGAPERRPASRRGSTGFSTRCACRAMPRTAGPTSSPAASASASPSRVRLLPSRI